MPFDTTGLRPEVLEILAMRGAGETAMPLVCRGPYSEEAAERLKSADAATLFPKALAAQAALSGLWLYFGCFDESHTISQDLNTLEGSYWHGILHRQEPDDGNAGYWFRRVSGHPVYQMLQPAAERLGWQRWDPFAFIELCAEARGRPGSETETLAEEVQLLEWQLLFRWCAAVRP